VSFTADAALVNPGGAGASTPPLCLPRWVMPALVNFWAILGLRLLAVAAAHFLVTAVSNLLSSRRTLYRQQDRCQHDRSQVLIVVLDNQGNVRWVASYSVWTRTVEPHNIRTAKGSETVAIEELI
jgi:hypothetical protein